MYDVPYHQIANYTPSPIGSMLASLIKIPVENKVETYQELACSEADQAIIYEIISTIATNNKAKLLVNRNYLKGLGAQIAHVHALKFVSTIIANPYLKSCLASLFDDYFKRNGVMDGIGPSLTRESDKGNLEQYINDFCAELNVRREQVEGFFQTRDWEGMVRFLFAQ